MESISGACNNLPKFNAQPIPYFCAGQNVNFNLGVTDDENDSLVYRFDEPLKVMSTPIGWQPGYSLNNPLPVPISLDSSNGNISFTPNVSMSSSSPTNFWVLKVCVDEYRNNTLISTTCRDFEFTVILCDNYVPYLISPGIQNLTGQGTLIDSNSISICRGKSFSFDVQFADSLHPQQLFGDSVTLTSSIKSLIPNASISVSNGDTATINISGTISQNAPPFIPFNVFAADDACNITGTSSAQFDLTVLPKTYAGPDIKLCNGVDTANIEVIGGNTYTWSVISGDSIIPGVNFKDTTGTTGQDIWALPNTSTTYRVVSDLATTSGCGNIDTITVKPTPNFNLDAIGDTLVCPANNFHNFSLEATTDSNFVYSYQWSNAGLLDDDTIMDPTATVTDDQIFSVTVTSDSGCVKEDDVFIEFFDGVPTDAGLEQIICQGVDTAFLQATSGDTFVWSTIYGDPININTNFSDTTGTTGQNVWAQPDVTTMYKVVSDLEGPCSNVDSVKVVVAPNFNLNTLGDTIVCPNDSLYTYPLDANPDSSFNFTYAWANGSMLDYDSIKAPIATISGTETFIVTATSDSGCIKQDTVTVQFSPFFPTDIYLDFADSILCSGDSTAATVDLGAQINANCGPASTPCPGNSTFGVIGTGTNAIGGTTYPAPYGNWYWGARHQMLYTAAELQAMTGTSPGAGAKLTSFGLDVAQVGAQTTFQNFEIYVTCTSSADLSSGWATNLTQVYNSASETISTGWNDYNFSQAYDWDGTSNLVVQVCFNDTSYVNNGNAYTNTSTTQFNSVRYSHADQQGVCSDGSLTSATSNNRPNGQFGYCTGFDPSSFSYYWTPSSSVSNIQTQSPKVFPSANTTYQLILSDTFNSCVDTLSKFINVMPTPNISFGSDSAICKDESLTLTATNTNPSFSYTWSTGDTTNTITIDSIGVYWVKVDSANLCFDSDSITISYHSSPTLLLTDTQICTGDTALLDAGNNFTTYSWSNGQSIPEIAVTDDGMYIVTVQDSNNCQFSDSASVTINQPPTVDLGIDTTVSSQEIIQLQSGYPTSTNLWSTGETTSNISVQVVSDTTIWNTVTDGNGCLGSDTIEISILTGSDQNLTKGDIKVYPNPARDNLTVSLNTENPIEFELIDLTGRILKRGSLNIGKNNLDISDLPKSNYQMRLISDDGGIIKVISVIKM